MDEIPPLNAKQRRKLLRAQQTKNSVVIKDEVKEEVKTEVISQEAEPQATATHDVLNAKERRRLARLAKQKTEVVTDGDEPDMATSTDDDPKLNLNAQQRRLLKRQAKRQADGVDEKKPLAKKHKKKEATDEQGKPNSHKSIHLTLFVGQLPYRATEDMILKHFAEAGDIKLRMLTDKKTNKFKGTAFIEVKDSKALGAALSRHHTLLQGRRINVELTASGGGNKSENRRNKIDLLRKKQSNVQVEKTKALIQKHIDGPEYKLKQEDVDDRMIDFLSWFDYETAKKALEEYNRCVNDKVNNRKAFFMGILKRFRQTDGVE
ncbi:RNA binding protein [Phytophthora palmivora]|uniref:RNA binding protein n=1 Tax=Phytophthora palmivora TaxID=4796 RepID=A0A2P4X1F8_9STRA|nr:RNA binding protein [Phytophthora palmivora]